MAVISTIASPFDPFGQSFGLPGHGQSGRVIEILDRDRLAVRVADRIAHMLRDRLSRHPRAIVAASVGETFVDSYAALRERHRTSVDWSRVVCVQMDEYAGLGGAHSQSLAFRLRRDVVDLLGIKSFLRFYDDDGRPTASLADYEQRLRDLGGIDCAIHGVGRNGHIAFNEPGAPAPERTRRVRLAESTRRANGVAFRTGVTLGMDRLCEARLSIVALIGAHKRAAAKLLLCVPPGPDNPAGRLVSRGDAHIYLDHAAAPLCLHDRRGAAWS